MEKVFENKSDDDRVWIYESPDEGKDRIQKRVWQEGKRVSD